MRHERRPETGEGPSLQHEPRRTILCAHADILWRIGGAVQKWRFPVPFATGVARASFAEMHDRVEPDLLRDADAAEIGRLVCRMLCDSGRNLPRLAPREPRGVRRRYKYATSSKSTERRVVGPSEICNS
jgi:hypothetical protein